MSCADRLSRNLKELHESIFSNNMILHSSFLILKSFQSFEQVFDSPILICILSLGILFYLKSEDALSIRMRQNNTLKQNILILI